MDVPGVTLHTHCPVCSSPSLPQGQVGWIFGLTQASNLDVLVVVGASRRRHVSLSGFEAGR